MFLGKIKRGKISSSAAASVYKISGAGATGNISENSVSISARNRISVARQSSKKKRKYNSSWKAMWQHMNIVAHNGETARRMVYENNGLGGCCVAAWLIAKGEGMGAKMATTYEHLAAAGVGDMASSAAVSSSLGINGASTHERHHHRAGDVA
jgi:hypothetical protein